MTAMQLPASKGREAMEKSLTPGEKVRRQLKAGRKPKTRSLPSMFEAVQRVCGEADRARSLMLKYDLEPDDIRLALLCRAEVPGRPLIHMHPLPAPGNIGAFIKPLEELASLTRVEFVGILWQLNDRDTNAKTPFIMWITEFSDNKRTALELLDYYRNLKSRAAQQ